MLLMYKIVAQLPLKASLAEIPCSLHKSKRHNFKLVNDTTINSKANKR